LRPGRVNLVDGNCSRTFSLFGDYILRRTRSPVAQSLLSLSLSLSHTVSTALSSLSLLRPRFLYLSVLQRSSFFADAEINEHTARYF